MQGSSSTFNINWNKKEYKNFNTTYTADSDGYVVLMCNLDGNWLYIYINNSVLKPPNSDLNNTSYPFQANVSSPFMATSGRGAYAIFIPEREQN